MGTAIRFSQFIFIVRNEALRRTKNRWLSPFFALPRSARSETSSPGRVLESAIRKATSRLAVAVLLLPPSAYAEKVDVYLTLEEAPKAVFPEADSFERKDIEVDDTTRRRMKKLVGRLKPTIWEPFYISFIASRKEEVIGYAVICEEIGKHRPITFIVGAYPDGSVKDVALMMYREPVGEEVRYRGFLKQFDGKSLENPIFPRRDIKNVTGATLSVRAMSRGVRKALAFIQLAYLDSASQQEKAE